MSTTTDTIAGAAYDAFERAIADNGGAFVRLKDDAPAWVAEAVKAAHGASGYLYLPCDWVYDVARDAFGAIHDAGETAELDDLAHEFSDGVDVYSTELTAWLEDYPGARAACETAASELGAPEGGDVDKLLQLGQYQARGKIFAVIAQAVEEERERVEEDEQ